MERKEINFYNMLGATSKVMYNNRVLFAHNPAITAQIDQLDGIISNVDALKDIQANGNAGNSDNKKQLKISLIAKILKISAAMLAHSATTNDPKLKEIASVSETSLNRLRDNDLLTSARATASFGKPIVESLTIWGSDQADLTELDSLVAAYGSVIPGNAADNAAVEQSTSDIKTKLKEAKALLKDHLDPMMLPFKTLNPTFYGQYENARQVIDTAASHPGEEAGNTDNK